MNLTAASRGRSVRTRPLGRGVLSRFIAGSESGQSQLEMALSLPILLLILTGIMTFGIALNNRLELSNAAAVGGHVLAADRGATDPCQDASSAIYKAAPFLGASSITISYAFWDQYGNTKGAASGTSCTAAAGYLISNGSVQLTLSYPCNLGVFGFQFWPGCLLTAQTKELVP